MRRFLQASHESLHTRVDSRDDTFHNDSRKAVEASQRGDDLTNGRQLSHHVEEERGQSQETEEDGSGEAVPLASPFGQDKAVGALAADSRAEGGKNEQRQGRRQGVDENTLKTRDDGQLGVREQDTGTESYLVSDPKRGKGRRGFVLGS